MVTDDMQEKARAAFEQYARTGSANPPGPIKIPGGFEVMIISDGEIPPEELEQIKKIAEKIAETAIADMIEHGIAANDRGVMFRDCREYMKAQGLATVENCSACAKTNGCPYGEQMRIAREQHERRIRQYRG